MVDLWSFVARNAAGVASTTIELGFEDETC
jgi:hypothetical protein